MGSVTETPRLSIIVPVLNEALGMPQWLARLQPCRHESCEIIVVDGGSSDNTVQLATGLADQIATSPSGRVVPLWQPTRALQFWHWYRYSFCIPSRSVELP